MEQTIMTIIDHFNRHLGNTSLPITKYGTVEVRFWPDPDYSEIGVVCTIGMSDCAQTIRDDVACPSREPRIELLSYCRKKDAEVFGQLLVDLSAYPFEHGRILFWWHLLPLDLQR
jgi:hypothetical protein